MFLFLQQIVSRWEVSVTSLETLNTASTLAANLSKIFTKEKRKKDRRIKNTVKGFLSNPKLKLKLK